MKKRNLIAHLIQLVIFITLCGVFPREAQESSPTMFALFVFLLMPSRTFIIKHIYKDNQIS